MALQCRAYALRGNGIMTGRTEQRLGVAVVTLSPIEHISQSQMYDGIPSGGCPTRVELAMSAECPQNQWHRSAHGLGRFTPYDCG